ncbi:MAG TPA: ABC-F family ATP-binding cassette domain-containing protein [Candidatus Paceibacterota bacterium]|nr:ABC-F family ATP-binding cassette domain-containing protein [Candidatus Paceibacterota bacterium]
MSIKNPKQSLISIKGISKKFDQLEILKDASFSVLPGEKIGLVGPNGSGKSTLFKILAEQVEKDAGVIEKAKSIKIEYLPQTHENDPSYTNQSGGEMARQILAPIIASNADLFLLDEPTNNLDAEGLEMIELFVSKSNKAFIIISHDRRFLDTVVTKILDIDVETKSIMIYDGNYSSYAEQKEAFLERRWKEYTDKIEEVDRLNTSLTQRVSWIKEIEQKRFNIRNLPIHEKEKSHAAYLRDKEAKAGRRARVMKDRLETYKQDVESVRRPKELLPLKISFDSKRGSTKVFDLIKVEKEIGDKRIGPIDMHIQHGDRIHITGPNGAGKTTFIKMLLGEIQPTNGAIERGETVHIGYVPQERWIPRGDKTVIEEFLDTSTANGVDISQTDARKILNRFRITAEDVLKHLRELSPGEYSRLVIAELVAQKPTCIILDEPTNHLDLEVATEIEKALSTYSGALIIASHDRYFVEKVGLDTMVTL